MGRSVKGEERTFLAEGGADVKTHPHTLEEKGTDPIACLSLIGIVVLCLVVGVGG